MFRTISSKILTLQLASTLVIAGVVGGAGYYGMSRMAAINASVYNDRMIPLGQLKKIADAYAVNIVDATHKLRAGTFSWDETQRNVADALETVTLWDAYRAGEFAGAEQQLIDDVAAVRSRSDLKVVELQTILEAEDSAALDRFVDNELYPAIDPLSAAISELIDFQLRSVEEINADAVALFGSLTLTIVVTSIAALIASTLIAMMVAKGIARNISSALGLAEAVSNGDLDATAQVRSKDELGDLVEALNRMVGKLRTIIGEVSGVTRDVAEGSAAMSGTAD